MIRLRFVLTFTCLLVLVPCRADDAGLVFRQSGQVVSTLSLTQMLQVVTPQEIQLFNPIMNKRKRYLAVSLKALLDIVYQQSWSSPDYSDMAFIALDGYEAVGDLDLLSQDGAWLAYEDLDWANGWEPVGRKLADPGPFFLVWTEKHQTTTNAFPWPWQISEFNLLRFDAQYPAVIPGQVPTDSAEYRGYRTFRSRCLRCHAMNQQGGKIGPDLNAPQSIVAYRSEDMIKSYIRQPSRYRYTQMPDHIDLTDADLDDLYRYFQYQDLHRSN